MLAWSIEAAFESGLFERILVSSDDAEMLEIARQEGASPHFRSADLAGDTTPLKDVAKALLREETSLPEAFCFLMANCPLRNGHDIRESFDLLKQTGADGVMSVVRYDWRPPEWAMKWSGPWVSPLGLPELERAAITSGGLVCPSGAIRWARTGAFLEQGEFYLHRLAGHELPWHRAIDIDTAADLEFAECTAFALDHGFLFGSGSNV